MSVSVWFIMPLPAVMLPPVGRVEAETVVRERHRKLVRIRQKRILRPERDLVPSAAESLEKKGSIDHLKWMSGASISWDKRANISFGLLMKILDQALTCRSRQFIKAVIHIKYNLITGSFSNFSRDYSRGGIKTRGAEKAFAP